MTRQAVERGSYVAFLPRGLTFIIPFRNSTKVPLTIVNECSQPRGFHPSDLPFNWKIQIRDIMQDEVRERFIPLLAEVFNKRLRRELVSQFVGDQPVLGERIIKFADD